MTGPRITFIGGGSYQWTPKLLVDIANMPTLEGAEIVIEDIDPTPIPRMVELVEHIARTRRIEMSARGTTDQREALEGADYVVVCISTGALDSMAKDIGIPENYGIKQSVGDTVGPGGILRALRNIPVLVGIARDMEAVCPDAWMLNLTNPMTTLTRAVRRETQIHAIGLCHEVTLCLFQISLLLDCDMRSLDPVVVGVNHLPLVVELRLDGDDALARLRSLLADPEAFGAESFELPGGLGHEAVSAGGGFTKQGLLDHNRVKLEFLTRFGVLPAAGDRHLVEFFPGFLTEASGWGERWNVALTSMDDRRAWLDHYVKEFEAMLAAPEIPRTPSGEMVAAIIDSRLRDRSRSFPLNIPNAGQCPDLPDGVVVESMCTVDASGVRGRDVAHAPRLLAEVLRRVSTSQELTVEAALCGDRDLVFEAMLADPLASRIDYDALARMTDEMLSQTRQWLPQFA
jgi:alpha-galactosidase/6-phospho-beta-glucosidase family protein